MFFEVFAEMANHASRRGAIEGGWEMNRDATDTMEEYESGLPGPVLAVAPVVVLMLLVPVFLCALSGIILYEVIAAIVKR